MRQSGGARRVSQWSSDTDSRCPTDTQNIQLGLIQTHIPQSQPAGENNEGWYEESEDDFLGFGFGDLAEVASIVKWPTCSEWIACWTLAVKLYHWWKVRGGWGKILALNVLQVYKN